MHNRRLVLAVAAAGGSVLTAALVQSAVAFADDYSITPNPTATQTYTGIGGRPPADQAVTGLQLYHVDDLTTGDTGSFDGVSLNDVDASGADNQGIVDVSPASGAAPPQGSFFDTANYGHGFENVYSDLVGTGSGGTNTIADTVVTPFGNIEIPTPFDATAALQAADFSVPSTSATFAGDSFVPDPGSPEDINSIGGTPPLNQIVSGTKLYDVNDAAGGDVGAFDGVSSNDVNAFGPTNQDILVAADAGFGGGGHGGGGFHGGGGSDAPPAGSFFDTVNYGNGFENVYSDVVATGTTPQTITDTFQTPFGDLNIPTTFDAAAAVPAAGFTFPVNSGVFADYSYLPDSGSPENITSIGGQALVDQTVSGTQLYDVNEPIGGIVGQFDAVSTHSVDALGFSNQEILVTADVPDGFVSADEPTVGSFFDTFGGDGFENVYSDIVGTGGAANLITDTLVTPFGDFTIPTAYDATTALTAAEFLFPTASSAAAELGSLFDLGSL